MHFYTNAFINRNKLYYTGYEDGERVMRKCDYEPYIFLPSKTNQEYHTLNGKPVQRKLFNSISDANKFLRENKDVSNFNYYGSTNWLYTWLNDTFTGEVEFDTQLIRTAAIDIEVASDQGVPQYLQPVFEITAITYMVKDKIVVFSTVDIDKEKVLAYDELKNANIKDFTYIKSDNEKDLLIKFLKLWNHSDWTPDVVTGWNIEFFDIPYLYNRIKLLFGEETAKKLSPWGIVDERDVSMYGNTTDKVYDLKGISTLDYMVLYKKFSFKNQESYALNHICHEELGIKKIDWSQYESYLSLYREDPNLFIAYNIFDDVLIFLLEEKVGLLEQVFTLAYDGKVLYNDTLTTIRMWDTIVHNYLMDQYIVVPRLSPSEQERELIGGYVKDVIPGAYNWVVSYDLASLYPHLIMQYNIGPDTFVGKLPVDMQIEEQIEAYLRKDIMNDDIENDLDMYSITANSCCYRRDKQGFLAALMEKMYKDRAVYKKKMIEAEKKYEETKDKKWLYEKTKYYNLQQAKKIQLNSAYGAIANRYFRFYNIDNAEAVTSSGQLSIRWVANRLNKRLNVALKTKGKDYIIAIDTDSMYINFEPIVNARKWTGECDVVKNIDAACKTVISPFIEECYAELAEYMNAYQNKMEMKREVIANKGIWTAKKRYVLNVWDSEGVRYEEPHLKIQGLESVRSSTPSSCRGKIKEALSIIMNKDQNELVEFVEKFREEFKTLPIDEIASPRTINGLRKYSAQGTIYGGKTPLQVRGALVYNFLLKYYELDKTYPQIYEGDKGKYIYLKLPNPIKENVITFINTIPKKFDLDEYIDYDTQFQKGFLDPLETITKAIGWKLEDTATLEAFM